MVGCHAENKATADAFADWMVQRKGGQKVVAEFERHGLVLYETAPEGVEPLDAAKMLLGR